MSALALQSDLPRLLLIPRAVGINLVGLVLALALKLPIFLDTTGTFLAAVLAGPWIAMIVGVTTNVVASLSVDPISLPFGLVNVSVGLTVGLLARLGLFRNLVGAICTGLIASVVSASVASIIVVFLFGGVTTSGNMVVTAVLMAIGQELYTSVLSSQILSDSADKVIIAIVVYGILKNLPRRTRDLFRRSPLRHEPAS